MKKLLGLFFFALLSTALFAQGGSEALGFTLLDRNPRTTALAGAGAASLSQSCYSAFSAAATLPFQPGMWSAGVNFQSWAPSNPADKQTNVALGATFHKGGFGVALGGAIQSAVPDGDFTPVDVVGSLGLSYGVLDAVSFGANLRYAMQSLAPEAKLRGFSADISILGKPVKGLSLLVSVAQLGPKVKGSGSDSYPQPTHELFALAYSFSLAQDHTLELVADQRYFFASKGLSVGAGLEYAFRQLAFARVGYRYSNASAALPTHLSLGLGLRIKGFALDVHYLTASAYLANTWGLGLSYSM